MNVKQLITIYAIVLFFSTTFALTPKESKWVITLESPLLVRESPARFTSYTIQDAPQGLDYRLSILPYDYPKDMSYLVIPTLGLISPIIEVPEQSDDYLAMNIGEEIDINKYLKAWVMRYPSTPLPGDIWNTVIFGHSNFFADKLFESSHKSIFADLMNLDAWYEDEIWIFDKRENTSYELKRFAITKSYETDAMDISILAPTGWSELTVFTQTDGISKRWIIKSELILDDEILVPNFVKQVVFKQIWLLKKLSIEARQSLIITYMQNIDKVRIELENQKPYQNEYRLKNLHYILNYIAKKLTIAY